ncbi:MAG: Transcriptional regulator, TetR family [Ignavibacteriae bacterium]|nr:MAG: Transcriptional regulator, TetR family [Ignavibacteriota bacterium]
MQENAEITQDLKKKQILEAAKQVFGKYGFSKTTLDDVATAVGMKKASLYYYYSSKEDLFRDVVKSETDELIRELETNIFKLNSISEQLKSFVKIRIDYLNRLINLHNLAASIIIEVRPICENLYREFSEKQVEIVSRILSDGIKNNYIRNLDVNRTAKLFILAVESITMRDIWKSKFTADIDYKTIEDDSLFLTELIINGLKK